MHMSWKQLTHFKNIPIEARVSMAYAVCSILQNCLQFVTLPLFARILTTEQYGQYTIYTSWSAILVIFITLNLPYGSFSTAMVKFEEKRDRYIASAEGICLLLTVCFLALYLPFQKRWNTLFELPTGLVLVMLGEMLANAGILFWSGKKRFEYRYKSVIAVTLLNSVLGPVAAYILVVGSTERGYARILGYAGVTILTGGVIFILNLVRGRQIFNRQMWQFALGFNLPLICYYLSQVVFNQSDRIMISHYCGKAQAAIYGVAYSIAMVLTFVLNAVNNSYVPWFYGKLKEGKQRDNRAITSGIAVLMAVLLLGVIWLTPEIIWIMAGSEYADAIWVVPPVAMSVLLLFYAQLYINVEFYFEKKKHLVIASIGAALMNIGLNAWLIPVFGFVAAGYTTLASYVIFVLANYAAMRQVLRQEGLTDEAYDHRQLILIFVGFMLLGFTGCALYMYVWVRYLVIAVMLAGLLMGRKRMLGYLRRLKSRGSE